MWIFVAGIILAGVIVLLGLEDERLGEDNERAWINYLADESKRKKHGRANKYSKAFY